MDGGVHRAARQERFASAAVQRFREMARPQRRVSLGRLRSEEMRPETRKPGLAPVGVSRELPADALAKGEWSADPEGGRVWRLALDSTGAEALRLHFADFHAGSGKVWLLGTDPDGAAVTVGPYTGNGPFGDGEFWTDLVPGDSVIVAYEPAADAPAGDQVPFRAVELSHRTAKTAAAKAAAAVRRTAATDPPTTAAATCALDVTCYAEYSDAASAVALMMFESDGHSYECTGSLVASSSQPALPFFLTANHCVSTAAEARSLIAVFNYQTASCGDTPPSLSRLPRVTGSTVVATQPMSLGDFSLLQLSGFPNVDVELLGWSTSDPAVNSKVTGISHPLGDYKRIAFGERTRDVTIRFSDGARMPANKGIQVDWLQGVTQSGSSGSPLLANVDGKQYVVGTLSAGPDIDDENSALVCRTRNMYASYGRFSAALPYLESILTSRDGGGGPGQKTDTPEVRQGNMTASANPIRVAAGQRFGRTTLTWNATGVTQVQIRVGSPTGVPLTGLEGRTGSATTGDWVSDGLTFYLQDASDGNSAGASRTLASVTVRVISARFADDGSGDNAGDTITN